MVIMDDKKKKLVPALRFGEFENNWEIEEFKNIVSKSKEKYNPIKSILNYPCIELESISQETGILLNTFDSKNQQSIKNTFRKGEILFGKLRPYLKKYIKAPFEGVCSSEIWVFSGVLVSNDFLYYLVQLKKFNAAANVSSGSKMPRADWKYLSIITFSFPRFPEQQKIANFLSSVDKKIEQLHQKVSLLEDYKKGVMQQIFSQQIRFKDDNGEAFADWEVKKLKEITKINQGLQIPISKRYTEKIKDSYFYITNEFLKKTSKKQYFIKNPNESVLCNEEDILMTRTGNTGQVVTGVEGAFHNNFFKIKFNKKDCYKWYLYYFLKLHKTQRNILKLAGSSTIPDLNHGDFYNIKISLPSLKEQQKIANYLSSLDEKIQQTQTQVKQAQKFKKGLLQQLFV